MRETILRGVARILRLDPYEVVGGMDAVLEREPPMQILDRLRDEADRDDGAIIPEDLATQAGNVADPEFMIETALMGEDVDRLDLLGEFLSDEQAEQLIEERELWPDPLDRVAGLPDDPRTAYLWILSDDATEEDRKSLAREFEEEYVKNQKREPQALHLIVRDVDEIKELSSDEIRNHIKPWLEGAKERDQEPDNGER